MKYYKLEKGISKIYKITTKEDFEEKFREKEKYIYKNKNGEKYGLAVCPSCDNPIVILGLYKKLEKQRPYARHHNESTQIATINRTAYLHCPYANPNYNKKYDKREILPLTDFERNLYYMVRNYFDKIIYLLNSELDFYISDEFAKQMLEEFVNSYAYRNEMANIHNLPYIMLDNIGNFNLICRLIKKNSGLWEFFKKRQDVNLENYNDSYDKVVSKSGFIFLQCHFYAHTIKRTSDDNILEQIKFGIIDSPDIEKDRIYESTYIINEYRFQNLCKNKKFRNLKKLDIAKEIMPELD